MKRSIITGETIREALSGVGEGRAQNIISIAVPNLDDLKRQLEDKGYGEPDPKGDKVFNYSGIKIIENAVLLPEQIAIDYYNRLIIRDTKTGKDLVLPKSKAYPGTIGLTREPGL